MIVSFRSAAAVATAAIFALVFTGCPGEKPNPPPPETPPAIVLPDASLAGTTVGLPYAASLKASGGKGTLTHAAAGLPKGLAIAAADGAISGSASESGDFTVALTVTDEATPPQTASKSYPLHVDAAPAFTTTTLPGATAGSPYVTTIAVTGGKAPVVLAVSGGEIPADLTFDAASATLAGTPAAAGSFSFTLSATDANGAKATQMFTLPVAPALELVTTSLPNGNVGLAYAQTLKAKGGKAPLTWELTTGDLPDGLGLDAASGKVSGTPTAAGPFMVTFSVVDANGAKLPLDISASIFANAPPSIATTMLPNAVVGLAYSDNLVASDGAPPYTWTLSSGTLPAGLTLSPTGVISGTATTAGPQSFQLTVTDANGQSAQKALTLTVYTELVIGTSSLPESYTGQAYNQTLSASGGQPPYTWTIAGGALPTGVTLTSGGILSGTPVQSGSYGVTISVTDSSGQSPSKPFTLTLFDLPQLTTTSLANAVIGANYSQPLTTSGGKAPFNFAITAGQLPAGIQLIGNTITGTPTTAGTSTFVVTATDANLKSDNKTLSITVYATLAITSNAQLPDAYVGASYTQSLTAAGGAQPYTWSITSGTLPAGLTLAANGSITGTPTGSGSSTFTAQVQAQNGVTATKTFTLAVRTQPAITTTTLPDGYVSDAYSVTLAATGGKTPYTFAVSQGGLPAGVTLSSSGVISGTPTTAGPASVTIDVTDANGVSASSPFSFGVYALPAIGGTTLADGYTGNGYSQTLASTGGKSPINWTITSGVLPAGLTLNASSGAISGSPTATGTALFTARATDANGRFASANLSIAVFNPPTLATTSLPDGTLNVAYSATAVANGGKAPLTWTIASGALPAGVTLASNGTFSGTPTAAGTSNFTLTVKDANNVSAAANLSIVVYASVTVSTSSPLPDAYQQIAYSLALSAAGGKSPYTWAVTAGQLPAGLTLSSSGTISGTPTSPATANFTVTVTDGNNLTASKPFALTVNGTPSIVTTTLPDGYVGLPYSATVVGQKGKPPYTFTVSMGTLPAGISLDSATGDLSGAPTTKGSSTFEITLTDGNALTNKKTFIVGIYDAPQITTASPLPDAYMSSSYLQTMAGTGGKTPYVWSVASGTLPAGLTLAGTGDVSGTATTAGTSSFSLKLTDANGQVATKSYTMTVRAPLAILTTSLPDGYVGTAYPAASIGASGGKTPYTFAVTGGALPAGVTLASNGALSGTPTTATAGANFTVTATDANGVTVSKALTIAVFQTPTITSASPLPDAYASTAYSQTLVTSGGRTPLAYTVSAGALPAGLSLSSGGVISGTTTATGAFSVTVTVTDANSVTASKTLALTVLSTLSITTTTLVDGYVGDVYSATASATGGKTPYTFSISSGALPAGLSLSGATISGTPTAAGTAAFTLTVTDGNGKTASQPLSLAVFAKPVVSTTTLADAYVGSAYSASLAATGGKSPLSWAVTTGTLPAGVTLSSSGALTGTPTTTGTASFTVTVTDANGMTASKALSVSVLQALSIVTASLPDAYVGNGYSTNLVGAGGKTPFSFAVQNGSTLPNGILLASNGALSGTPTTIGLTTVTFVITDANGVTATKAVPIEVLAVPTISTTTLADGYPSIAYSDSIAATGGRTPYTFTVPSGLPAGVTVSSSGALSGTPTTAGTFTFTANVTDANGKVGTKSLTIIVRSALVVTTASLPDGYIGNAYSQTLAATGGKSPFTWSINSGALPAGVTLTASSGALSGTPTAASTYSFTARVTDANGVFTDKPLTIVTYAKPSVTSATPLPDAYVSSAYSQTLAATGGKAPLTWSITAGGLPAGLTLSSAGVVSGTATTAGAASFTVQVQDANGQTGTKAMTMTVLQGFFITTSSLPDAYTGTAYSQTLAASGGLAPYTWTSGTGLPAGITLSTTGVLSGTPTTAGTDTFTVTAKDANNATTSKTLTIVVRTPPTVTTASLPDAYVGTAYNQTLAGSGGATPYTWTIAPALSAGLTLSSGGALTGTPSASKPLTAYTVTLTDLNGVTATKTLNLTVYSAPSISVPTPPDAYVTVAYSLSPAISGGKAPITWSTSGTVPAWVTVSSASGQITGTPNAAGAVSFTLIATDANGVAANATVAFTVYALPSVTTASLPTPYVSVPYSATLTASGGKAPLTWSISSGTLPTGVTLTASSGALSGNPSAAGTYTFTTLVTDANGKTANKSFTLTVPPAVSITTSTLADAYRTSAYNATVAATGGLAPYTFSLSSGTLPSGLALASAGAISGTPTATAVTSSFVVLVTDANNTTATKSLTISVADLPAISTASLPDGYLTQSYSQTITATGGSGSLTYSITAGALPAGVTLNAATGALSGTPTTAGTASFTVTVTDANGKTASKPLSIGVYAVPTVDPLTFTDGYAVTAYSKTLTATGGKAPITWSITLGALPPGLSLNAMTGVVGTMIGLGVSNGQTFTFTVQAQDANGQVGSKAFAMNVWIAPTINAASLTQAIEGVAYFKAPPSVPEAFVAQNGKPPRTWSISGLPSGLTLVGAGGIGGTPAQGTAGTYTVTPTVTDANGVSATGPSATLTVVAPTPILGGGTRSTAPTGSPVTNDVTIFVVDSGDLPRAGVGVRLRKNGAEFAPVKEALTNASGKAYFGGLGLNGTTDSLDITVNGRDITNVTMAKVNAALVTVPVEAYPLPGKRFEPSGAYDTSTNQLVVFGGQTFANIPTMLAGDCPNNTLRLTPTGASWAETIVPAMPTSPQARYGAAMATLQGGQALLFGGTLCQGGVTTPSTYLYNFASNSWVTAPVPPLSARTDAAIAPFQGNQAVVYGGNSNGPMNDAALYQGGGWLFLQPPPAGARYRHAGAYRSALNEAWFCGGTNGTSALSDCFAYNGGGFNGWITKPNLPFARDGLSMAYDPAADRLYAFGGVDGFGNYTNDLVFSSGGSAWIVANPGTKPPGRTGAVLAWDATNSRLVMFGGVGQGINYDDVWTYSFASSTWTRQSPVAPTPPATYSISGAITGGYPPANGQSSFGYVSVTTSSGKNLQTTVYLSATGSGSYTLNGIPAGDTITLMGVNQTSLASPSDYYSYVDFGVLGPITSNTTQNIAFPPGPISHITSNGTLGVPSDWSGNSLFLFPTFSRAGYPAITMQNGSGTLGGGAFTDSYLPVGSGTAEDLLVFGQDMKATTCETSVAIKYGIAAGNLGAINLIDGPRSRTPGATECTTFGNGFTQTQSVAFPASPGDSALVDLDGDGDKDLVLLGSNGFMYRMINNNGSFAYLAPAIITNVGAFVPLDFNKDGKIDFATSTPGGGPINMYLQTASGGAWFMAFSVPGSFVYDLDTGDFNGDGNPDVVATYNSAPGQVTLFLGNGSNNMTTSVAAAGLPDPRGLAVGDLNGDGFQDLVVACGSSNTVRIFNGVGNGTFSAGVQLFPPGSAIPTQPVIADFDGDGDKDIAVALNSINQVGLYLQTAPNSFTSGPAIPGPAGTTGIAAGDFDADGKQDVLVSGSNGGAYVMKSTGNSFQLSYSLGGGTISAGFVDFDADGVLDVVVPESSLSDAKFFKQQRSVPVATDGVYQFTAPANAGMISLRRGARSSTTDWLYYGPAISGLNTVSFPLPSTLAPSRSAPSQQSVLWQPTVFLNNGATPINRDELTFSLLRYGGYMQSGGMVYTRQ